MKSKLLLFGVSLFCLFNASNAAYGQGTAFTYQGRLNNNGTLASGRYDLRFTIYDSSGGSTVVAGPLTNSAVVVSNGLFAVTLDFGAGAFSGPARWLDIAVRTNGNGAFVALNPRQALTAAPYAVYSGTASNVTAGSVVKSLNNLKDNVTLAAGANVTLTPVGNTLTLAATGGSDLWDLNGASAYYNGGSVGIGTMAPATALEVNGVLRSTRSNNAAQYLQLDGGDPVSIRMTAQSTISAEKALVIQNLSGEAVPGANNSILFAVGTTAAPSTKMTLTKDGNVLMAPGGSGGTIQFGSPNFETGMSIVGANRADVRFDGSTLKLLASAGVGIPPSVNGIVINTLGNVGMGTTTPAHHLSIIGGPSWTANGWIGSLELGNASAMGWRANANGKRFGIGQSTGGLFVFHSASDPGTTGSPANYDLVVTDNANVAQPRDKGGLVKAMLFVNQNGTIARCYNGITDSATGGCGFTVTRTIVGNHGGVYVIDFGFQVNDRFISVTPHGSHAADVGATFFFNETGMTANQVAVDTFLTDVDYEDAQADASFMIIVY